jgi:hypothetical protein
MREVDKVGVMDAQRRADSTRFELVDTGAELSGAGLSAHTSGAATRESVRLPAWLREVNGHRLLLYQGRRAVKAAGALGEQVRVFGGHGAVSAIGRSAAGRRRARARS